MATDPRAQKLLDMLKKYCQRGRYGPDVLSTFRLEAVDMIEPDENVYHIVYVSDAHQKQEC